MRLAAIGAMGMAVMLTAGATANAQTVDLHALWHDRCQGCHGHAGSFARERAPLPDQDRLSTFLTRHGGGLPPGLAAGTAQMLSDMARTPDRFMQQCRICHGRAADFVRQHLSIHDGRLVGRYSGTDVEAFLEGGHARITGPEDAAFFTEQLRRVLGEVRFAP